MDRRTVLATGAVAGVGTLIGARPAEAATRPLRVRIVLFDGVEEQDFIGPQEVFSLAGWYSERPVDTGYTVLGRPRTITAAFGTRVTVDRGWRPHEADVLIVPGGGRPNEPGIWAEINNGALPDALAAARRPGLIMSSVCTGAVLLAAAGLLTGRPCTTHTVARAQVTARGGVIKNARVVDDGDLVTAGGITSGLDLALHLIGRELHADVAIKVEEALEYQARGTVWTA
ncbi:DJ-1/PfpI family protein [Catenuloplanes atrovinosus]|uniref:Transcriptional regulator GlxA family with amidase domain n=1 Tax=Catenuloplanes atrovinosus TaxID=137266 RepID=A0AAE4CCH9_9ACTN|nr:DJ-1/PfpI family protein [Catenuloplanes atrovinosus]MDR7276540.1 transcriptional regulator GlxA family with amidase domain [Catenuloplanes atrovinosus]